MKRHNRFQGVSVTDKYLTVHFVQEVGTTIRVAEVKVPLDQLLQESVTEALDRHVRRKLILAWSNQMEGPGLFD